MSAGAWRVEFTREAADETRGITDTAFDTLMAALAEVTRDPWGASRQQSTDDVHDRVVLFSDGAGMASVTLDPGTRTVWVHAVTWLD